MAAAGIVIILAVAWLLLRHTGAGTAVNARQDQTAVAVQVEPIHRETIRDVRRFTGTLYPAAQFDVAPRIGGQLKSLLVDIGDRVHRGQVIARLDDAEYVQQVEQAQAQVEVAQAGLIQARSSLDAKRKEYARSQELRKQNIASQAELDANRAAVAAAEAQVKLAEAQVKQQQAAMEAARVRLGYTTITADWQDSDADRVVGERHVDEGTTISANTPIVSVLDIHELICVIFVTEKDYARLKTGQAAEISTEAYPGHDFNGRITRIAPMFRETSRQARVEIRVPNGDSLLKPGMFVNARIILQTVDDATVIPVTALVHRDGRDGVFVADRVGKKAHLVPVTTGITAGNRIQISKPSDLSGDVITLGQYLLSDDSSIIIPDVKGPAAPATPPR